MKRFYSARAYFSFRLCCTVHYKRGRLSVPGRPPKNHFENKGKRSPPEQPKLLNLLPIIKFHPLDPSQVSTPPLFLHYQNPPPHPSLPCLRMNTSLQFANVTPSPFPFLSFPSPRKSITEPRRSGNHEIHHYLSFLLQRGKAFQS